MKAAAAREVWLIRHAESAWNAIGRWQGQGDPMLSERGRSQARALAEALAEARLAELWSSDLRRAHQTAAALSEMLDLPLRVDARLRERDLGSWCGLSTPQIAGRYPDQLARLRAGDPDFRPEGGESLSDVRRRAADFLATLVPTGGRVALVTHGGWIRALMPHRRAENAEVLPAPLDALRLGASGRAALPAEERL